MSSLVLGTSNQIIEAPGKHYNVELWTADFQMTSTVWAEDQLMTVTLLKIYNQVTCQVSLLPGEADALAGTPGDIHSVPGTQAGTHPTGKIPNRFLPANLKMDITYDNVRSYWKAYPAEGKHQGVGYTHLFQIKHFPVDFQEAPQNGEIVITFNNSSAPFTYSDASLDSGNAFTWLTNSNINIPS